MRTIDGLFEVADGYTAPRPHSGDMHNRFYQRIVRAAKRYFRFAGTKATVHGLEHVPLDGGAMLAINHTGYLDFMLAGIGPYLRGERLVRFMAKKEVFGIPVLRWLLRNMGHVPVDRSAGAGAIDAAVAALREGAIVGIFPEGTISRSFEIADFKTGAVRIARQAGVPLVPCVIWGSQRLWAKDQPKRLGRSGIPVIIRYGEPVAVDGTVEEATGRLKAAMEAMLETTRAEYETRFGPFEPGEPWMPASLGGSAPTLEEAAEIRRKEREAKKGK